MVSRNSYFRWVPFLGFHHCLMIINVFAILLWSFLLAACTSTNGLNNVYLLSLSYNTAISNGTKGSLVINPGVSQSLAAQLVSSNNTIQELRIGYLYMCMDLNVGGQVCSSNVNELVEVVKLSAIGDPLNLLQLAQYIKSEIFFYPLIIISNILLFVATLLMATIPGWHEEEDENDSVKEVKPFPSRPVCNAILSLLVIASALGFVSAFWQHIGASAASTITRHLTYDLTVTHVGPAAVAFGWIAAALTCVSALAMLILILAIRVLARLAD